MRKDFIDGHEIIRLPKYLKNQTVHFIQAKRSGFVLILTNKRTSHLKDFILPAGHIIK